MLTVKDTSLLKIDTSSFRTVESDRLFYDRYNYCVLFRQTELSALRGLNADHIDSTVAMLNRWRNSSQSGRPYRPAISELARLQLHQTCAFLQAHRDRFKLVISFEYGYLYTNDLKIIEDLKDQTPVWIYEVKKIAVTRPKDTVLLRNPQHEFRTYLKNRQSSHEERVRIKRYFEQRDSIRVSPGLQTWLKRHDSQLWNCYINDYFFFDHVDNGELFMFQLAFPGFIRKTMPIVAK